MAEADNIKACVFDAYGTLFDVHSAVGKHRQDLGDNADAVSMLWRQKQLEYTWLRSLMRVHADFWQVTGNALDYALEKFVVANTDLREKLMQAYLELNCYPEVPQVLAKLKEGGIKTAILSNGEPKMLAAAVKNSALEQSLDAVLSIEDVGIYKPDSKVYQLATNFFDIQPEEVLFQTSNAWDAAGAAEFGFKVAWINRFAQPWEKLPQKPNWELSDLNGLLPLVI